jgi:recA bacterial DNA recombination protein
LVAARRDPQSTLAALIAAIQQRWGSRALRHGHQLPAPSATLSSGFAALDTIMAGGFPRGSICELLGAPTSGIITLALHTLAVAQQQGALGAYLDVGHTFDAAYAAACGIQLAALVVIRPDTLHAGLELLLLLAERSDIGCLVIDSLAHVQHTTADTAMLLRFLPRIQRALLASQNTLIALTPLPYPAPMLAQIGQWGAPLAQYAAVRIYIGAGHWHISDPARPERQSQVYMLKQRGTADGQVTQLWIPFPDSTEPL